MARKEEDTTPISCSVLTSAWRVLTEDMQRKGYKNGNGFMWRYYLGAIAAQIVEGKINIPKRLTR